MRVVHVVTLISSDAAFGGPVSVAVAQADELARRGHDVRLIAGWDGAAPSLTTTATTALHRVRRMLPAPGFSGLVSASLLRDVRRSARTADVVHVHLARDLVTLPAARVAAAAGAKVVTQTHGMVMPDPRAPARALDAVLTRPVLHRALLELALTETEAAGVARVARGAARIEQVPNGVRVGDRPRAARSTGRPVVLFAARLHPRKRVLAFAEMARILLARGVDASFLVAGADEGDLARLRAYIAAHRLADHLSYVGPVPAGGMRDVLAGAAVFVLPSEREPFPMTLLEAMAEGTPAVITSGCMIAADIARQEAALVTDGSAEQLALAVEQVLGDPAAARSLGARGERAVRAHYSIAAVVDRLEVLYRG